MALYVLFTTIGLIVAVATYYMTFMRSDRQLRQRFFREALGAAAKDGFPGHPSLFQRLDNQDTILADVQGRLRSAGLLNGQGESLVVQVSHMATAVSDIRTALIREGIKV